MAEDQVVPRILTKLEAAHVVNLSTRTLERAIERGELVAADFGRRAVRIKLDDLMKWFDSRPRAGLR